MILYNKICAEILYNKPNEKIIDKIEENKKEKKKKKGSLYNIYIIYLCFIEKKKKKEGQKKLPDKKKIITCNTAFSIQDGTINGLCDPILNLT